MTQVYWSHDGECWNALTNAQTPEDFMYYACQQGHTNPTDAVAAYVQDIPAIFPDANYSSEELGEIRLRMTRYLQDALRRG